MTGDESATAQAERSTKRAMVIHPVLRETGNRTSRTAAARLEEAVGLAAAIDLEIVGAESVRVTRMQPATLFGSGTVETIGGRLEELGAGLVIIDSALTPIQQRNLERAWKAKVIDRTGLILEIFGERARTREGQLQVELAALTYQRSRLVRSWTHLERQRGGFGFLGGPGESQLEIDRRLIEERIIRLKKDLEEVRRTRDLHRKARKRVPYPVVALVGYTNAGKSTLFNRLAGADVFAKDLLFATLDPTMRAIEVPSGRRYILSDTVGFISDLPTHLVAAFRATLEEVQEADLILHVRDVAHPDTEAQMQDVLGVLGELGIEESDPRLIEVLNKVDLLDNAREAMLLSQPIGDRGPVAVSALSGEGIGGLIGLLDRRATEDQDIVDLTIELADGATLAWLYENGNVIARRDSDTTAYVRVGLTPANRARLQKRLRGQHDSDRD